MASRIFDDCANADLQTAVKSDVRSCRIVSAGCRRPDVAAAGSRPSIAANGRAGRPRHTNCWDSARLSERAFDAGTFRRLEALNG